MSKFIKFRNDSNTFARAKSEAKIVRDCFDADVSGYLKKFPTESEQKFEYRKDPYISKFTNFVASAINSASGIALKKIPKVNDDELKHLPLLIGTIMASVGCDGIGYLLVDAPKLADSSQKTNVASISYISIDRVIGDPVKNMNGDIVEFTFEGQEDFEDDENIVTRKYRKKIFIGDDGVSRGEKYTEVSGGNYEMDTDPESAEWIYSFDGLPVSEIDILTSGKHPYIEIAKNNLWLYNLESDERNIIHFICSPYVQFFGEVKEDHNEGAAQIFIGADRARRFNDKTTEGIEITEAQGTGVMHATKKIESASDQIAKMSASALSNANYKTATQAENAEGKALGFLPYVIISVENAVNQAIDFMALFRGAEYSGGVEMNKKFSVAEFNAGQLSFVKGLYDSGVITKATLLDIAKDADLIKPSINNDEEIAAAEIEIQKGAYDI